MELMRKLYWLRIHAMKQIMFAALLFVFLLPASVFAHATLVSTEPAADSRLELAPSSIELQFNQKLEALGTDSVSVMGPAGEQVVEGQITAISDGKGIIVPLQKDLISGTYIVNYQVLSLDGHQVKGSYSFSLALTGQDPLTEQEPMIEISNGENGVGQGATSDEHSNHDHHENTVAADVQTALPSKLSLLSGLTFNDYLMSLFYISLLSLLGLVFWGIWLRGRSDAQARRHRGWMLQLQRLYFLVLIGVVAEFIYRLVGFNDWTKISSLMLETTTGLAWLILLVLSAIGMFALGYSKLVDSIWLLAVLAVKSQIGHAAAVEERLIASLMTGIHLLAASVWVGGLLFILFLWRRYRYEAEKLLPTYSGISLVSLLLLIFSGIISSALYLPDLGYILETRWGLLLIAKLIVVVLVGIVVGIIRSKFRRRGMMRISSWLKLDIILMLFIAALAGLLTSSEPIPPNEPLHWHVMGDDIHMTADISPRAIGINTYGVTVWLPEGGGEPQQVVIKLLPGKLEGENDQGELIPLVKGEGNTDLVFVGFDTYHYYAQGDQINQPGWWRIVVEVTDGDGKLWEYKNQVKVY
jgi:copper transport protein